MAHTDAEEMLEQGVGLIVCGLFRIGNPGYGDDPDKAFEEGSAIWV